VRDERKRGKKVREREEEVQSYNIFLEKQNRI
jgi:hypothetical protein